MKKFFSYIWQYRRSFLTFSSFSAIFAVILFLYDSHPEAVLYAFVVCAIIGITIALCRYIGFCRKNRELQEIFNNLPLMTDKLPAPDNVTERRLHEIIRRLTEKNSENLTRIKSIQQDNSEYFTVWVHQIKTPISAIQMILQMENIEFGSEISTELFKIEQYAEMALNFIRLDSDSNDLVIRRYDLDKIIRQAIRKYASVFIRRKIKIDYEPIKVRVITDEKWLEFVIEQFLSNAVKYTVEGSISIRFENDILSVRDTGIGIAPEDLPRIFEKGYTGMSGRTNSKSTGLGLYLCKKVCNKLGHEIYAKSDIGKGSCFFVDLSENYIDIE